MNKNTKWYASMLAKLGSDEAIAQFMSDNARKRKNPNVLFGGKGYFGHLKETDPDKLRRLSIDSAKKRHEK